jgi:ASCH domain
MGIRPEREGGTAVEGLRASSIRQPYAEQILRGTKKIEYRTVRTNIRGKFLIYASLTPGPQEEFQKVGGVPGDLPTGEGD